MDLDEKVFGSITIKEIIGETPNELETREKLNHEFEILMKGLEGKNQSDLSDLLEKQKDSERIVNSRPGAMALSQNKIRLFNEFSSKYVEGINRTLES